MQRCNTVLPAVQYAVASSIAFLLVPFVTVGLLGYSKVGASPETLCRCHYFGTVEFAVAFLMVAPV